MKTNKDKQLNKKFSLEKFEVVKLKNLKVIFGGGEGGEGTGGPRTTDPANPSI